MMVTWLGIIGVYMFSFVLQHEAVQDDPIFALHAEYIEQQRTMDLRSVEVRRVFYEVWLERFREVVRENPDSPHVWLARWRKVELLNGLDRYGESVEELELILSLSSDLKRQDRTLMVLKAIGGAAYNAFLLEKDEKYAEKSIASFRRAREMRSRPVAGTIRGLRLSAQLESWAFENHARSAENYLEAYEVYQQLSREDRDRRPDDGEQLLFSAMKEFAQADKVDRVFDMLQKLEQSEGWVAMGTILQGLLKSAGQDQEAVRAYVDYAAAWLDQSDDDRSRHNLLFSVARQYDAFGETDLAIQWYEKLVAYAEAQRSVNRNLSEAGIRLSLYPLLRLYRHTGQHEKVRALSDRYPELSRHLNHDAILIRR